MAAAAAVSVAKTRRYPKQPATLLAAMALASSHTYTDAYVSAITKCALHDLLHPKSYNFDQIIRYMQLPPGDGKAEAEIAGGIVDTLMNDKVIISHHSRYMNGYDGVRPFYVDVSRTTRDSRAYVAARPLYTKQLLDRLLVEFGCTIDPVIADERTFLLRITDYDCTLDAFVYGIGYKCPIKDSQMFHVSENITFAAAVEYKDQVYPSVDLLRRAVVDDVQPSETLKPPPTPRHKRAAAAAAAAAAS